MTVAALLVLLPSCLRPPGMEGGEGRPASSRAAHKVFSHRSHEKTLTELRFLCTDCHLYNVAFREGDEKVVDRIAEAITRAGLESCHFCHRTRAAEIEAFLKCIECHGEISSIRPEDHRAGWERTHGSRVGNSEHDCSNCHSNRFCVRCHTRRDEASRSYHTGSAIVSHPIEARADPTLCGRCHSPAYCVRCHQRGGSP